MTSFQLHEGDKVDFNSFGTLKTGTVVQITDRIFSSRRVMVCVAGFDPENPNKEEFCYVTDILKIYEATA